MNTIYHLYDKIFKKILTLSSKAVINLINGLFNTNYPLNSNIQYNWTEFENDELKFSEPRDISITRSAPSFLTSSQLKN